MKRLQQLEEAQGKLGLLASTLDEIRGDPEAYAILETAITEQMRVEMEMARRGLGRGMGTEALLHIALVAHAHCVVQVRIEKDVEKALAKESSLFLKVVSG